MQFVLKRHEQGQHVMSIRMFLHVIYIEQVNPEMLINNE